MNSRERMLAALDLRVPDRLPVTTHHLMPSFLASHMPGTSDREFFDTFALDAIAWVAAWQPDPSRGAENWRIEAETLPDSDYRVRRYKIITPIKTLSMVLRGDQHSDWVAERLIKEKADIELIAKYAPIPLCDVAAVNRQAAAFGERGIIRGTVPMFDVYGQPGCWQDAAVLYGIEPLIMATFDDPGWVKMLLEILKERKLASIASMRGARFDLLELGGGDASSTVISPRIFADFVGPYDSELIACAHRMGQRVVYHTCGGMMPLLEGIADMNPDAMETFTPASLGGDADLREAKARIGERVCMIGGFDQCRYLTDCAPEETRRAVRDCFAGAGGGGGYILAPSDHFFAADLDLLHAFADEARRCVY